MANRFGVAVVLLLIAVPAFAREPNPGGTSRKPLQKNQSYAVYRPFLINAVFNYYGNNGDGSFNIFSQNNEGFELPKGSGKTVIFEDGVVWGGYHRGFSGIHPGDMLPQPKAGGSQYRHAIQPGPILTYGTPSTWPVSSDPSDPQYRI